MAASLRQTKIKSKGGQQRIWVVEKMLNIVL